MKTKTNTANPTPNPQTMALEDAEYAIRKAVKDAYFLHQGEASLNRQVFKIISDALRKVTIPALRDAARRSLLAFYKRQDTMMRQLAESGIFLFLALAKLRETGDSVFTDVFSNREARKIAEKAGFDEASIYGAPASKYMKDYIENDVAPVFDRMAKDKPYDPDSEKFTKWKNTLRNRAEAEVRYQKTLDTLNEFKGKGVRLVIISAHADCSERCRPFQGRVFSLDGSTGTTDDGRSFVPLEKATDIFETTQAGKIYKNGLFGFNCRHYMVEYKPGFRFLNPSPQKEREEYKITIRQRQMETRIRNYRVEAEQFRGIDRERYLRARKKAIEWNRKYQDYSRKNGRAYYPSRTKIL